AVCMDPVREGPEPTGIPDRIDFPCAGVEPGKVALVRAVPIRVPVRVAPAEVGLDPRIAELFHLIDVRSTYLNLGKGSLYLAIHARHVVRDMPPPPEILRGHDVFSLPGQHHDQRHSDLLAGF